MNGNDRPVSLGEHRAIRHTSKALLVTDDDCDPFWIPQSVIHENSEVWKLGNQGELIIKQWFAEKQGWV